jgi:hypothetical protein
MATPPREFAAAAMRMVGVVGDGAGPEAPRRTQRNRRRFAPSASPSPAPSPSRRSVPPPPLSAATPTAAPADSPHAAASEPPEDASCLGLTAGGRSLSFTRESWQLLFPQEG